MSKINYRRGETRQISRKRDHKFRNCRTGDRSKGLARQAQVLCGFGRRCWCPCCQPENPYPKLPKSRRKVRRRVSRAVRQQGKEICLSYLYSDGEG